MSHDNKVKIILTVKTEFTMKTYWTIKKHCILHGVRSNFLVLEQVFINFKITQLCIRVSCVCLIY